MTTTSVVTFDRIGRNHEPPSVSVMSDDPQHIAEAVYAHARHYLASRDVEVVVEDGKATIFCGFQVGGTGKVTVVP